MLWSLEQVRYKVYTKIPRWIKSLEISNKSSWLRQDQNLNYDELLNEEGELLQNDDLENKGIFLDWWTKMQIKSRIKEDEKIDFREKGMAFKKYH